METKCFAKGLWLWSVCRNERIAAAEFESVFRVVFFVAMSGLFIIIGY
jgi:hypothetical protein